MSKSGEGKMIVVTGAAPGTGESTRTFRSEDIDEAIRFALERPEYVEVNEIPNSPTPQKH